MLNIKNLFFRYDRIIFVFILILAILLRIYFLLKPGYSFDINCFLQWGNAINSYGLNYLYHSNIFINYPPLIPVITACWLKIGNIFSTINLTLYFKILPTIFELILLIICSFFIFKSQQKYKYLLLFFVLIQPALALISSAWGQIDSILSLFIILAFVLQNKHTVWSAIFLALSILVKPQAIIAVGVYFLIMIFTKKWKNLIYALSIFTLFIVFYAVFFKFFANINFFQPYFSALGSFSNTSLNAFNFWWVIFGANSWNIRDVTGMIISYKIIGLILFGVFSLPALYYLYQKRTDLPENLLILSYFYLIFFVYPTEMHERYLYYSLALMAIPAILNWKIFVIYIILTTTVFFNCYFVLQSVYPQFAFLKTNMPTGIYPSIISWLNVIITIYLAYYFVYEATKTSAKE